MALPQNEPNDAIKAVEAAVAMMSGEELRLRVKRFGVMLRRAHSGL
jgi:hypothetical protein